VSVRYAEDLCPGTERDLGSYRLTRNELIEFAERWDPQSFHVDASASGYFGDVIASGAHTLAIFQRLSVLSDESHWAVIAGVGLRDVRFLAPVRPDVELRGRSRVESVDLEPERRRGLVTKRGALFAGDTQVLDLTSAAYVRMRAAR